MNNVSRFNISKNVVVFYTSSLNKKLTDWCENIYITNTTHKGVLITIFKSINQKLQIL